MTYLYCVMLVVGLLFSLVTSQIFSYKRPLTVQEIVDHRVRDMEGYLFTISKTVKAALSDDIFD